MGSSYVKYPNLELLEYQFSMSLANNPMWRRKFFAVKGENKYVKPEFEVIVFPQIWGSTNTAFDIDSKGNPTMGGCAMTKAYTVVIREVLTNTYGVYVDSEFCYLVDDVNDAFYKDLQRKNMASVGEAKKKYQADL